MTPLNEQISAVIEQEPVAVRVVGREPELLVDLRLELLGQGVLEQLRLGVNLVE